MADLSEAERGVRDLAVFLADDPEGAALRVLLAEYDRRGTTQQRVLDAFVHDDRGTPLYELWPELYDALTALSAARSSPEAPPRTEDELAERDRIRSGLPDVYGWTDRRPASPGADIQRDAT